MFQISALKLGRKEKNNSIIGRIWLQGLRLARANFVPGASYSLVKQRESKSLTLELSKSGDLTVSKKKQSGKVVPVIDIHNQEIAEYFGSNVSMLQAVVDDGRIVFTVHPDEQAECERVQRLSDTIKNNGSIATTTVFSGRDTTSVTNAVTSAISTFGNGSDFVNNLDYTADDKHETNFSALEKTDLLIGDLVNIENTDGGPLLIELLKVISATNPSTIILDSTQDPAKSSTLTVVHSVLETMGYDVSIPRDEPTAHKGVIHMRTLALTPSDNNAVKQYNSIIEECVTNSPFAFAVEATKKVAKVFMNPMKIVNRLAKFSAMLAGTALMTVGSIAHGGGVLDKAIHDGMAMAGVKTHLSFAIEVEQPYLQASIDNNPIWHDDTIAIHAPMEKVSTNLLPQCSMIVAGLPCTGASLSGRSKNKLKNAESHATAGALFIAFLNIIHATDAPIIVLENVPPYANTSSMMVIRSVLEAWGYDLHETVVDESLGALEKRKRMCLIAVSKGINFDINSITPVRERETMFGQIMEDVADDDSMWRPYPYLFDKAESDLAAGKGFKMQIVTENDPIRTIGRHYAKVRSTEPLIKHPRIDGLYRLMTPIEHARGKTIDPLLIQGLSNTIAHQIMGQSVLSSSFEAVGRGIGQTSCGGTHEQTFNPVRDTAVLKAVHNTSVIEPNEIQLTLF